MDDAAVTQATFCATLVDEWVRAGVRHAVVAPGSRSTPLALALAADGRIAVQVQLDERCAAFTALGVGVATGVPAVALCTSGTAATHFHAAVVEAHHARVPLLVCTADRPPELRDVGAPQTIDQTHLYGRAARWFADPGPPDPAMRGAWRSLAARAVAEAADGPVHLNLPFREPLVAEPAELPPGRPGGAPWHVGGGRTGRAPGPERPEVAAGGVDGAPGAADDPGPALVGIGDPRAGGGAPPATAASRARGGAPRHAGGGRTGRAPELGVAAAVLGDLAGRRGVVVAGAGAGAPEDVAAVARRLGWPVLADPRSGCTGAGAVHHADALLRSTALAAALAPEAVLRLGAPPASKVLAGWLAGSGAGAVVHVGHPADPDRLATVTLPGDAGDLAAGLAAVLDEGHAAAAVAAAGGRDGGPGPGWVERWVEADGRAEAAIAAVLAGHAEVTEPGTARAVLAAAPAGGHVVVSSSMPIRDVEWYGLPRAEVAVHANRGANGIDGVVSTAVGVAVGSGAPTTCLLGDVALLHDSSGLTGLRRRSIDLTVVVVDNDGGGIFSFLPQASTLTADRFEQLFGTPHGVRPEALAAAHGIPVAVVERAADLDAALAPGRGGARMVVARTDRAANVALHAELHAAIAAAVAPS